MKKNIAKGVLRPRTSRQYKLFSIKWNNERIRINVLFALISQKNYNFFPAVTLSFLFIYFFTLPTE